MIERACDRFRREISSDDARLVETTASLDDVKLAIRQVEQTLAARQQLRNVAQITPFVDAIERYSRALDVLANGTPYLPYIWAPLKIVLQATQDCTHALDKILSAYASIGHQMPRFSRYAEAFPEDRAFQHLVAFLFEDILEFHRHAYAMIRKPAWKIFFKSAWGRFDQRFGDLLGNISRISDQIDREAMSIDIIQAADQRRKDAEKSNQRVDEYRAQQLNAVLKWLEASDIEQEQKLEMLQNRHYEGTLNWISSSPKLRAWLQRGRGKPVLWLHGKPGSGKSVLSARLISSLQADPSRRVCYYFCDFHTPTLAASGHILKVIAAQLSRMSPDFAPFLYEECIAKAQRPSTDVLQKLLPHLLAQIDDVRLVVDGLDEISASEHRQLISDLLRLTKSIPECKLLLISQDIPSISVQLSKQARFSMADEQANVRKDLAAIVEGSLTELKSRHLDALGAEALRNLQSEILQKAEGMFLWVHLVLELLTNASCLADLRLQISSLPASLGEAYSKILINICSRCSTHDVARIRRVFAWLLYHKGRIPLRKHQIQVGISLFPGRDFLNDETKPFPNTTDICKPLIEDGPRGSLVFVHSTVAQFLEEHGDVPFINRLESRASIAYACICQLYHGLDFLNTSSTSASVAAIASGIFALWPYSYVHWIEHLLDCFEAEYETMPERIRAVLDRAELLCQRIMVLDARDDDPFPDDASQTGRFSKLMSQMDPGMVRLMIRLHNTLWEPNEDDSPLARAMRVHQDIVESLMRQDHVAGISHESLLAFKEAHGPIAFVCNVRECERAVIGFPSKDKLKEHQGLHLEALGCYEKDCFYNDVGFPTARSLQQHKRKCHGAARLGRVPKRLRRVSERFMEEDDLGEWTSVFDPQARRRLQVSACWVFEMTSVLCDVRFSPDGKKVAVCGDTFASIFETRTRMLLHELAHNSDQDGMDMYVRSLCFSPNGNDLATGGDDGQIRIWDTESGTIKITLSCNKAEVYSLDFASDGNTLVSGGGGETVRLWNVQTGSLIKSFHTPGNERIWSVAISPNDKYLAISDLDGVAHVFDIENETTPVTILGGPDGHKNCVHSVIFSPDGKKLVTGSLDRTVKIWELGDNPHCLKTLEGHEDFVISVTFTPNAHWILSGSKDRQLQCWDAQT
ncbi:hypothetical protein FALCPG4_007781, partial [Fusarium falciforme]